MLSLPIDKLDPNRECGDAGSPMTVLDAQYLESSPCASEATDEMDGSKGSIGRYTCPHVGCNQRFRHLSDMTDHERNAYHADRRPPMMRRLFGDSHGVTTEREVDLRCNSVLSSPAGSNEGSHNTEVASLTLESSVCSMEDSMGFSKVGTEDLWKNEIPVMDPLEDGYLAICGHGKETPPWMMTSSGTDCGGNGEAFF